MLNPVSELNRDEKTEYIYDMICFGRPANPQYAEDIENGINSAIALDMHPSFLEGLAARLTQLGIACSAEDSEVMLTEVKTRYKDILGKPCPRTVQ